MRCGEETAVQSLMSARPLQKKKKKKPIAMIHGSHAVAHPRSSNFSFGVTGGGITRDVANAELLFSSRLSGHFTSTENTITRHGRTAQLQCERGTRLMVPVSEWTRSKGIN